MAIVAQHGSPQRAIRGRSEIRRTSLLCFFLVLVLSGSWQVTHLMRAAFGPGDLIFVEAGAAHRFEAFEEDFATWVIFWGPKGGEGEADRGLEERRA